MPSPSSKHSKAKWSDMSVTRVHLNPEQAVLSCCDSSGKGAGGACGFQCGEPNCDIGETCGGNVS